ncbi:MAG: hypothetical protein R3B47_16245 [Bacteroidia bacterium]
MENLRPYHCHECSKSGLVGYSLVSLLIGVNDQYQGSTVASYAPRFEALLQRAIALAGGDKNRVFVLSIPDYAYTPYGQSTRDPGKSAWILIRSMPLTMAYLPSFRN